MARVRDFAPSTERSASLTAAERVLAAIDEMACDPQASTTLVGLAAGVSSRRAKAILAAADTTFTAELLERRMSHARELLGETNFAIAKVARLCGYRCPSTFASRFASQNGGLTPRQYRAAKGGQRRVGGTTGAFRRPARRARAEQDGVPAPAMSRYRSLPGTMDVYWAERANERRRAELRGERLPPEPDPRFDHGGSEDYSSQIMAEWAGEMRDELRAEVRGDYEEWGADDVW